MKKTKRSKPAKKKLMLSVDKVRRLDEKQTRDVSGGQIVKCDDGGDTLGSCAVTIGHPTQFR